MLNDTATDTLAIDTDTLVTVTGGVRPGPNGEGCTGPRPRPSPTFSMPSGPVVDPAPDRTSI